MRPKPEINKEREHNYKIVEENVAERLVAGVCCSARIYRVLTALHTPVKQQTIQSRAPQMYFLYFSSKPMKETVTIL
jgi:hypothetical protein